MGWATYVTGTEGAIDTEKIPCMQQLHLPTHSLKRNAEPSNQKNKHHILMHICGI